MLCMQCGLQRRFTAIMSFFLVQQSTQTGDLAHHLTTSLLQYNFTDVRVCRQLFFRNLGNNMQCFFVLTHSKLVYQHPDVTSTAPSHSPPFAHKNVSCVLTSAEQQRAAQCMCKRHSTLTIALATHLSVAFQRRRQHRRQLNYTWE